MKDTGSCKKGSRLPPPAKQSQCWACVHTLLLPIYLLPPASGEPGAGRQSCSLCLAGSQSHFLKANKSYSLSSFH